MLRRAPVDDRMESALDACVGPRARSRVEKESSNSPLQLQPRGRQIKLCALKLRLEMYKLIENFSFGVK